MCAFLFILAAICFILKSKSCLCFFFYILTGCFPLHIERTHHNYFCMHFFLMYILDLYLQLNNVGIHVELQTPARNTYPTS